MALVRILTALLLVATLAGCQSAADEIVEQAAERAAKAESGDDVDVEIDDDGGTINVNGEDGTNIDIGGGELPDGFPDEFPLPEGEVTAAMRSGDDDTSYSVLVATGFADVAEAAAALESDLEANDWTITETVSTDGADVGQDSVAYTIEGHGFTGQVGIVPGGDGPLVQIVLES